MCSAVVPKMVSDGGGAIVNVASMSSFIAQPEFVPYNTSKAAIVQLSRCMAYDLASQNIRVNTVCPGPIYTQGTERHAKSVGMAVEELVAMYSSTPGALPRIGTTREIGNCVAFLASDSSSFVHGTTLIADGGYTTSSKT
mmetsp:Transcript_45145/g.106478  ORF Transcript_45145/g.106478 Transcript_45145/m.106478 type:complete len:140 (+) Transcript_45145:546-965(+)